MKNNGYIITLWLFIWNSLIKNSIIYKVLQGIYNFISRQWRKSLLIGVFRKTFCSEDAARSSLWGKICFSPFLILEKIQAKNAEKLVHQKEKSFFIRIFKHLLHNILALNLRFIGVFVTTAASVNLVISLFRGGNLMLSGIAIVLGIILSFIDFNVTGILKNSWIVSFMEKCFDTEFSFNFYYITKCGGTYRLYSAAGFGAICGIICGLLSPLFGLCLSGEFLLYPFSFTRLKPVCLLHCFLPQFSPQCLLLACAFCALFP